jgi:hypothetical protein
MAGPDLPASEQLDLYLLRKHLGLSYREVQYDLPVWEVELLLNHLKADLQKGGG